MNDRNAIIYVRVSTDKQVEQGASLETQEKACLDWCHRHQIRPLQLFRDEGRSAKTLQRPEMQRMLEFIGKNYREIDFLLVYQMDRLTRSNMDYYELIKTTAGKGIEIRDSASRPEQGDSSDLVQGINILMADHDNRLKSRRVRENMKRKANDGYRMHKAPLGLKNVRDIEGKSTVAADDQLAPKIAKVLEAFSSGNYRKKDLANKCTELNMYQTNGKEVSIQLIDKLLKQPLYAGLERSTLTDNEYVPSVFKGIISQDVYFRNQDIMSGKKDSVRGKYKIINPLFPLRGFVRCDECSNKLSASSSTGRNGKKYPRYNCNSKSCSRGFIGPKEIHSQYTELLNSMELTPNKLKLIKTVIIRKWNQHSKTLLAEKHDITNKITRLEQKLFKLNEKYVEDELEKEDYLELKNDFNGNLKKLKNQLADADRNLALKNSDIDKAIEYLGSAPRLWNDASPEMKGMYQRMVFPEGISYNLREKKFGTAKYGSLYSLAAIKKDPAITLESLLVNQVESKWNLICSDITLWLNSNVNKRGLLAFH